MVFYVTVVTYLVTLLMNRFTSIVIPTYFEFIQMPIVEEEIGIFAF